MLKLASHDDKHQWPTDEPIYKSSLTLKDDLFIFRLSWRAPVSLKSLPAAGNGAVLSSRGIYG